MFRVLIGGRAERQRRVLPSTSRSRVDRGLEALARDPRPRGAIKLSGVEEGWRIRIGDYRVLYTIDDREQAVRVYRIGHRREVYR